MNFNVVKFVYKKKDRKNKMNWYVGCWKKYATFSGRARRKEYWMFVLVNLVFSLVAAFLDGLVGSCVISGLYAFGVLLPGLAVTVRRLHDTDRSGWWVLIAFVPFVGGIWLLVLMTLDSSLRTNRFGSNPKVA